MGSEPEFEIFPLADMLERYGKENLESLLSSYKAARDSATEAFLRHKAIEMELRDLCRTYLAVSNDPRILGFVSIGIKCLSVPERNQLSGKVLKSMNIETGSGVAQSYLLGQLSRSEDSPKGLGHELLDVAFEKLDAAKRLVGCRMVRLDCHDELIPYYQAHGSRLITKNAEGTLNQMMAFVQSRSAEQEVTSSRGEDATGITNRMYGIIRVPAGTPYIHQTLGQDPFGPCVWIPNPPTRKSVGHFFSIKAEI